VSTGHHTGHRCVGKNHGREWRDGDAGEDADEQLASQNNNEWSILEQDDCRSL
jgi:hypothetical protein